MNKETLYSKIERFKKFKSSKDLIGQETKKIKTKQKKKYIGLDDELSSFISDDEDPKVFKTIEEQEAIKYLQKKRKEAVKLTPIKPTYNLNYCSKADREKADRILAELLEPIINTPNPNTNSSFSDKFKVVEKIGTSMIMENNNDLDLKESIDLTKPKIKEEFKIVNMDQLVM